MYASNNFQNIIFLDFLKKNEKNPKKVQFFFIKICVRLQQFSDFFRNLCTLPTIFKILFFWFFWKMPKKTFRKIWVRLQLFFQKFRAKMEYVYVSNCSESPDIRAVTSERPDVPIPCMGTSPTSKMSSFLHGIFKMTFFFIFFIIFSFLLFLFTI